MDDKKSLQRRFAAAGRKGIDGEEGPGQQKQNDRPEIARETVNPPDGQGHAEIRPLPQAPELSPKPDKLEN